MNGDFMSFSKEYLQRLKLNSLPKRILFALMLFFTCCCVKLCASDMSPAEAQVAREKFVAETKKYVGSPYVLGAVGPDTFDCSGLIYYVARESLGIQLPRTSRALYSYCRIVPENKREVGDLVFFKTNDTAPITHVGIYIGNGQFISAISDGPNTGVIISSLNQPYWKPKYVATGQFLRAGTGGSDSSDVIEEEVVTLDGASRGGSSRGGASREARGSSGSGRSQSAAYKGSSFYDDSANGGFLNGLVFDAALFCDWSLISPKQFMLQFRGIDFNTNVRYAKLPLEPGLGFGLRFNSGLGLFQIPLLLSATLNDYVRFYVGPVFSFSNATMVDTGDEIRPSVFPGILGVSFSTPNLKIAQANVQLVQDLSYTVFNHTDNSALSFGDSIAAGFVFYTGVRVTMGMKSFL